MGRLTVAGLIAALTLGTFVLVASAQQRAPFWATKSMKLLSSPMAHWEHKSKLFVRVTCSHKKTA
jgi:hypothetical protein